MEDEGVDIAIISEPRVIPDSPCWLGSTDGLAAVCWKTSHFNGCKLVKRNKNYVIVRLNGVEGKVNIVSCYLAPSMKRKEVQDCLDAMREDIKSLGRNVIVEGDFNAKSPLWGSPYYSPRGREVEDWAAETDLYLINEGKIPTCIRPQGTSIVDLSWSTVGLKARITDWRVRLEIETLSDYACVEMVLDDQGRSEQSLARHMPLRWKRDQWDFDLFRSTMEWELQGIEKGDNNEEEASLERMVGRLGTALRNSCDVAGERVARGKKGRRVYWWSAEWAEKRRATVAARRKWTKVKIQNGDPNRTEELRNEYRERRRELRRGINKAKREAWGELLKNLDEDPWGLGYKIVMNKLRMASPILTETMEEETLLQTLRKLFPEDKREVDRPSGRIL